VRRVLGIPAAGQDDHVRVSHSFPSPVLLN